MNTQKWLFKNILHLPFDKIIADLNYLVTMLNKHWLNDWLIDWLIDWFIYWNSYNIPITNAKANNYR